MFNFKPLAPAQNSLSLSSHYSKNSMALNSVLSWFVKKRIHQIELFKKYPIEVQNELLMRLIKSAQHTEWGVKYNYKEISNLEEY